MSTVPTRVELGTRDAGLRAAVGRFFFAEEVPCGVALVRILLPLSVLWAMAPRWLHTRELYSADGAPAPLALTYGYPDLLPELPGTVVVALHSILLLALVTSVIGWRTRISLVLSTAIYTYLNMLDAVSTMTKYSVLATHALLLLSLSQCGAVWSVDSWLRRRIAANDDPADAAPRRLPTGPAWPRRLIQILIGVVYFGAAVTKIHTPTFFSGEQMQAWMITDYNSYHPLGLYLAQFPSILVMMGYETVVWEMLFLFLAWGGRGRWLMLGTGIVFHVLTGLTLGIDIFPAICISIYFSFLNERDVERIAAGWQRWKANSARTAAVATRMAALIHWRPGPTISAGHSRAAFAFAVVVAGLIGVEAEHLIDPYGLRRSEGPYELVELDPQYAAQMLTPSPPIRDKDKFTSFETGSIVIGGYLLNRHSDFAQGETITLEFGVAPPHEDMWVECDLQDSGRRIVETFGMPLARESLRGTVAWRTTEELAPGAYWVVLKTGGREMMRKPITIRSAVKSPVAN